MKFVPAFMFVIMSALISGCATEYQDASNISSITGGYLGKEIEPGIWRVEFGGNGYTTVETVQTYWLYRCTELTLSKGYQGFKIISNTQLSRQTQNQPKFIRTSASFVYVPMYTDSSRKPELSGDIQLLKAPFELVPGKVFDAAALKAALEPLVSGPKCDSGNVCPHVHRYIYPNGTIVNNSPKG